ncbi:beta strand repeat-containing protein [Bradyrhizobium sp. CCGE-LA001]|uniref:beta strand repeat-containing protein n=1 Tax=Bradyrhizobium sp. CCGE-LA001 TaxID=1223566 RepID=UPI000745D137|nr:tail fiber domain-containing protein [Bradyrhizobium sp. CCGE-LA001]AMA60140.1 hypothetical protein BCCGELA001_30515 [Bradyrhizobium sp. CCGE-LA001]
MKVTPQGTGILIASTTTPTAPLEVSGTVSATRFVGDGSGLTGIVGASSGDNIASGTTRVTANTTGYISFTTGGTTTGYMDTAGKFILPGVSTTGLISATAINAEIIPLRDLSDASASTSLGSLYIGSGVGTTGNQSSTENTAVGSIIFNSASMSGSGNTAIGRYIMQNNTSGMRNAAVGRGALYQNTTGNDNVALGYASLFANQSGFYNTAIGSGAAQSSVDSVYNVIVGSAAANFTDTISQSVLIGHQAGYGVSGSTTGLLNEVMIGFKAGYSITTGGYNTFLGTQAGYNVTTGGNNIMIGSYAYAPTATSSNMLDIGNLIYGNGLVASSNGGSGIGEVGINYVTPSVALEVSGTVSATRFVGDGSLLTGIVGSSSGDTIASGTTKMTANQTGYISFTTGGTTTGYMDTSGKFILPGISTTGPVSATNGYFTGPVGIGTAPQAGYDLYAIGQIRTNNNVIIGNNQNLMWGDGTTYIRGRTDQQFMSLYTSSTEAMRIVSTGQVGIGTGSPTSGYQLTVSGSIVTNNNMVANGSMNAQQFGLPGWSETMSGSNSGHYLTFTTSGTEAMRMVSTGYVGIGTNAPANRLDVAASANIRGNLYMGQTGASGRIYFNRASDGVNNGWVGYPSTGNSSSDVALYSNGGGSYLTFYTNGTERVRIDNSGLVGIATATPTAPLEVSGTISASSINLPSGSVNSYGWVGGNSAFNRYQPADNGGRGGVAGASSVYMNIDSNNDESTAFFAIAKGSQNFGGGTELMRLTETGFMGVGTVTPTTPLEVSGTVSATTGQFNSLGTGLIAATGISITTNRTSVTTLYASGAVQLDNYGAGTLTTDASGNVTASSDERLKDIKGGFTRGLEAITSLNPIVYQWNAKSGNDMTTTYAGFSAQDVQKAIPEAVSTDQRG